MLNIHNMLALANLNKIYTDCHTTTNNERTFNDKDYIVETSKGKFGLWNEGGSCINALLVKDNALYLSTQCTGGYYKDSYDLRMSYSHTNVLQIR